MSEAPDQPMQGGRAQVRGVLAAAHHVNKKVELFSRAARLHTIASEWVQTLGGLILLQLHIRATAGILAADPLRACSV
jgi:hypothetical protein